MGDISNDVEMQDQPGSSKGFASVDDYSKNGLKLIMEATKAVNALPSGSSRDLYTAHSSFNKVMETQSEQILNVIHNVLKSQSIKGNIVRRDKEEKFELLQECNDSMIERINSNLDELSGIKKNSETTLIPAEIKQFSIPQKYGLSTSWINKGVGDSNSMPTNVRLITAKNIARPQINFKVPVDNSNTPFIPRLKYKPNSVKPLAILPEYDDERNIVSYLHPYEVELERFEAPDHQLCSVNPTKPLENATTPLIYIDTVAKLNELMSDLEGKTQLAVDLEHHSYRTFQGITCLMQLSTRDKDYIIDTIALREDLHLLNEVFTNPKVVKVFHGADSDIEWLQRDLSIYVVNMFDTHQAARRLEFARCSLAFLLKHYCNIEADKTFQLADWRMRPLPSELINYAQQDTHNLLYIFDMMTNDLLKLGNDQANILRSVYQSSKEICMKRYNKLIIQDSTHLDLYRKSKRIFDNRQLFALKEIYSWRDKTARSEDESTGYILPNHMLLQMAESLPREMQGILACCNPIPSQVRQHLQSLHQIILKARDEPLIKSVISEEATRPAVNLNSKKDLINNPLYCPHDLSHFKDIRDDLPTLLGKAGISNDYQEVIVPEIFLFKANNFKNTKNDLLNKMKFVTPYQRYLLMIPYIEELRAKELLEAEEAKKVKPKPVVETPVKAETPQEDDLYKLPLKELKKRKYNVVDEDSEGQNSTTKKQKMVEPSNFTKQMEAQLAKMKADSNQEALDAAETAKQNRISQKKSKPMNKAHFRQNSNKPVPFDYASVDYKKFGGQSSQGNQSNSRGGGRGRGRGNMNNRGGRGGMNQKFNNTKKLDKMFSFSSVKLHKTQKK